MLTAKNPPIRYAAIVPASRLTALIILLATMLGPWFADGHPATEEDCTAPLVYLGGGMCACLVTFLGAFRMALGFGQSSQLWILCLPPALPFLSTLLLTLGGERRWTRTFHLAALGLASAFALFVFIGIGLTQPPLLEWGAGLYGVLTLAMLAMEILLNSLLTNRQTSI